MQSDGHEHEVAWLLELAVNPGQLETVRTLMDEMVAAGRTPNTEGLGQDAFGVVGSRGHHTGRFRDFRTHPRKGE